MGIRLVVSLALLMWHSVAYAASFTVINTDDSGTGSLRQAIMNANGAKSTSTIAISATGTIALLSALPPVGFPLTITGPGADKLTIQGSPDVAPVITSTATLQVSGVTITGGANGGNNGGGIFMMAGSLTLLNSTITGNTATLGGGIYSATGELVILSSTISGNTGTGAIYGGGDISVVDSTIADNHGTAIVSPAAGAMLSIESSTLSGNTGGAGEIGGIQLQAGSAEIHNTTFSGNTGAMGGDVWTSSNGVALTLSSVTAAGGSAPALLLDHTATVMLRNTVLAGTGARCSGNPLTSQGHNLSSDTTCNLTQPTDKPGVDPMLGPLAANGGATRTHAPLAGSPAVNAGDGAGLSAKDQRGLPRVQFAVVDIGAVEVSEPMVVTQPAPLTVAEGDMFTLSVGAMNQNSTTPLTYQWRKDGVAIAGGTSATFTNPAAAVEDAGMYDVMVINDGGGLPSMAVAVAVTPAPKRDSSGGCCSATSRAAWPDAVVGLALAAFLAVPRRRRAARDQRR
jgi:hypothetical protein